MAKKTDNGPQNITQKNNTNLTKNGGGDRGRELGCKI